MLYAVQLLRLIIFDVEAPHELFKLIKYRNRALSDSIIQKRYTRFGFQHKLCTQCQSENLRNAIMLYIRIIRT